MKMFDADRTQILNACQFLRDRGYSLVDSDEYSIDLSDGEHYSLLCTTDTTMESFAASSLS